MEEKTNMPPDWLLLRRYAQEDSQEAFAALTARYLGLVYSVCLREVHDPELAQDVTQAVFLLLARTAPAFRSKTALPGWLFRTARFAAQNARTRQQRRRHYEEKAAQMMQQQDEGAGDAAWTEIEPVLNSALAALREGERACVLLRFFQGLSFAEAGAALGLSEEAARKRVTRALEKMRAFFGKEGVVVPGVALAALLSTHAAKAAPAACSASVAAIITSVLAGHSPLSLTGSHVYQLSEGVLRAMKIAQMKVSIGVATTMLIGGGAYAVATVARAEAAKSAQQQRENMMLLNAPVPSPDAVLPPPEAEDADRNVVLTGKVFYENGKPAGGIQVAAQIQNKAMMQQFVALRARLGVAQNQPLQIPYQDQKWSWNNGVSKPDGSYELPVAADTPYNVMVFDTTGKWVAAGVEGVQGQKNTTVEVPDLLLTSGALVVGTVIDSTGRPLSGVSIGSYGPHRPASSATIIAAKTDVAGRYRLRVAPGLSRIYVSSGLGNASQNVDVTAGKIVAVNFASP